MLTPKQKDLAMRLAACKHWRWRPGMLVRGLDPTTKDHAWVRLREFHSSMSLTAQAEQLLYPYPDLADSATLGCLLALVREAWDMQRISTFCADGWWGVHSPLLNINFPIRDKKNNSEAAALVAALEASDEQ